MNMEENGVASKEHMNWVQTDSAIMSILAATLSNDALTFIVGSKTSREIWCRLKEKYVDDSRYNIMNLTNSVYHIQKGTDSIDRYLLRVKSICDQLAIMGVYMDDEDIVVSVLNGLPSEFSTIKAIIRIKALSSSVSMRELRSLLLIAEDEINQTVKSSFERFKTELMTQGDSVRGSIPAPTHITSAKYDGGIPYNFKAFNNGTSLQTDFHSAASLPSLSSRENSCFAKKGDVVTQHGGSLLVSSAAFNSKPQDATMSSLATTPIL